MYGALYRYGEVSEVGWQEKHGSRRRPGAAREAFAEDGDTSMNQIAQRAEPGDFLQLTGALWRAAPDRSQPMPALILDGLAARGPLSGS